MRAVLALPLACLLAAASVRAADPDPADLLGKWELTEAAAKMPAGTVFDFKKDGKLTVTVKVKDASKSIEFGYSLKGATLSFELPNKKADTTEVVKLTKSELVCKDNNGTMAKFKRVKVEEKK